MPKAGHAGWSKLRSLIREPLHRAFLYNEKQRAVGMLILQLASSLPGLEPRIVYRAQSPGL